MRAGELPLPGRPDPLACAEIAHALCRLRMDQEPESAAAAETATAIAVLARFAPVSANQQHGVRLARRMIDDIRAGRAGPADPPGEGARHPSLTDYIVALTGNETFTCTKLVDVMRPFVKLSSDHGAAAHRINVAINRDRRFRRHEHGVYTRVHHEL